MRLALSRAAFGAALLTAPMAGFAQGSDATVDALVRALRPGAVTSSGTRGIRPIAPNVRAAPVADRPAVSLNVDFASGSDALRPGAMRTLDELGRALTTPDLSAFRFRIEGHTDTVGPDDMNTELSERRAQTVARYLTDKFQVPATRMQVVGLGKHGLAVATSDQVAEERNRRVGVVNIGT